MKCPGLHRKVMFAKNPVYMQFGGGGQVKGNFIARN